MTVFISKLWILVLLFLMLLPAGSSHAAHPLITDDAGTQGTGKFQLELNGEYAGNEETEAGVTAKETGWEASSILSYGISETTDIVLGIPFISATVKEAGDTVYDEQGLSDVSLELKWRFFESGGASFALKPGLMFPTGDEEKGLGTGKYGMFMFLIATQDMEPVVFHLNLGYLRNNNKFDEEENLWHASLAAEWKVSEAVTIVANIGAEKNPDPGAEKDPAFALAGIIYAVSENLDIDLGYKAGLNDAEMDYAVLAGVAWRF